MISTKLTLLVLFSMLYWKITVQWKNDWDRPLNFQCSSRKSSIHQIVSYHDNKMEDRRFDFNCRHVPSVVGPVSCSLSGYVNDFDAPVLYSCPNGGYINGISSYHHNHYEDRRYRFRCCVPYSRHCHRNCSWTNWVNDWDSYFNYFVPSGYVIRSVHSIHDNHREDRRFQFEICQIVKH
uniref:Hemagglutinin/amebocyte aggregation factor-like isoform X1 n=2 Tax=Crassostrea virginica TaxID=6565 RepID=A0A8B8ATF6_CRAVI|nr:hemagglutinin/amebocyte aggregation factor-like isoform X1 [Crassostrea virginica]